MFSVILVEIVFCATYSQQSTTMMGRTLLGVLCLSGWNISSCLSLQYHYVADPKNWTEAQTYCREKYTDLATVETPEEMKQLNKTVLSSGINLEVWIGVYRKLWKWPDNYTNSGAEYRNWRNNNRIINYDFKCYVLFHNGEWYGHDCINAESFICYRGSQQNPEFVYVSVKKNWSSAQRFCRENFIDLATVKNHSENQNIQSLVPEYTYSWIGLYWDPDTYWSDGSGSSFRWFSYGYGYTLHPMSEVCGAADLENSGRWWLLNCETKCPFVCYSVRSSVVKRQVIKLRMKPENSSMDLNDPAVKADILNKLQDRLKKNGLSGVTLKWREQPDGKVFHKERKMSKKKKKREKTEL